MHPAEERAIVCTVGLRKANLNFPHYAGSCGLSSVEGQKMWFRLKHNPALHLEEPRRTTMKPQSGKPMFRLRV
jgi:hypothetical protein